jgi:hypothetical protein
MAATFYGRGLPLCVRAYSLTGLGAALFALGFPFLTRAPSDYLITAAPASPHFVAHVERSTIQSNPLPSRDTIIEFPLSVAVTSALDQRQSRNNSTSADNQCCMAEMVSLCLSFRRCSVWITYSVRGGLNLRGSYGLSRHWSDLSTSSDRWIVLLGDVFATMKRPCCLSSARIGGKDDGHLGQTRAAFNLTPAVGFAMPPDLL